MGLGINEAPDFQPIKLQLTAAKSKQGLRGDQAFILLWTEAGLDTAQDLESGRKVMPLHQEHWIHPCSTSTGQRENPVPKQ